MTAPTSWCNSGNGTDWQVWLAIAEDGEVLCVLREVRPARDEGACPFNDIHCKRGECARCAPETTAPTPG